MSTRGVAILGSTGSIGCNTLRVIESLGPERFRVVALGAGRNIGKLADQIAHHQPELVSVEGEDSAQQLRVELTRRNVRLPQIVVGEEGLIKVATHAVADCVVSAVLATKLRFKTQPWPKQCGIRPGTWVQKSRLIRRR